MTSSANNTAITTEAQPDISNDKIEKMLNEPLTTSTIIEDVNTFVPNITPQVSSNAVRQPEFEALPENKKDRVAKFLNDTVLPSKSQMSASDPFAQIMSKDYLLYFTFGASVALFALNLIS